MSALWTVPIYEHIDQLDWGKGHPSKIQRDELKRIVSRYRMNLEFVLGLYELNWRRATQGEDVIKL